MRANDNQRTIIRSIKQMMENLELARDINHPNVLGFVDAEIKELEDVLLPQERLILKEYMQEIYLFITNLKA